MRSPSDVTAATGSAAVSSMNERLATRSLRRLLLTLASGLVAAGVIIAIFLLSGPEAYAIAYAVILSIFASLVLQFVGTS